MKTRYRKNGEHAIRAVRDETEWCCDRMEERGKTRSGYPSGGLIGTPCWNYCPFCGSEIISKEFE